MTEARIFSPAVLRKRGYKILCRTIKRMSAKSVADAEKTAAQSVAHGGAASDDGMVDSDDDDGGDGSGSEGSNETDYREMGRMATKASATQAQALLRKPQPPRKGPALDDGRAGSDDESIMGMRRRFPGGGGAVALPPGARPPPPGLPSIGGGGDPDMVLSAEQQKQQLLIRLRELSNMGWKPSKSYTMNSALPEMEMEVQYLEKTMKEARSREKRRKLLVMGVRFLEEANEWAGPFLRLKGWHKSVSAHAEEFDEVTAELAEKYGSSMEMPPEGKLLMLLGQSAYMHHVQAIAAEAFVRQNLPSPEEMARANPELMQTMMQLMHAKAAQAQAAGAVKGGGAPSVSGGRGAVSGAADPIAPGMEDDGDDTPPGDDEIERLTALKAKALPKGTLYRRTERNGANVPSYTDMRMPPMTRRRPPRGAASVATAGDDDDDDVAFG